MQKKVYVVLPSLVQAKKVMNARVVDEHRL